MKRLLLFLAMFVTLEAPGIAQVKKAWDWPFKQNEKVPGVEFRERTVRIDGAALKTWKVLVPVEVGGGTVTDLNGNFIRENPRYTGHVSETHEVLVKAVSEQQVLLSIAGKADPFWNYKTTLEPMAQVYVQNLEVETAKKLNEPGANALTKLTPTKVMRDWTDIRGNTITARFVLISGEEATFRDEFDRVIVLPISRLCDADRSLVNKHRTHEIRIWRDVSGTFSLRAKYIQKTDDTVTLQKEDGQNVSLPIEKLSKPDRKHLTDAT